ncbi:MAG: xanthine dehydrogenase family protein molybdopterin-binding subunit, partial [Microvirga sp.]
AAVVADTRFAAADAAVAVEVAYEPLPAVTTPRDAVAPGAPLVHARFGSNLVFEIERGDRRRTEAAMAAAAKVVELSLNNNRLSANPIEPRAYLCDYDAARDRYTLHATTQQPHYLRRWLSVYTLHIPEHKIRVISPDVGGAFGVKGNFAVEVSTVVWAAQLLRRPVKWTATRTETFLSDAQARDHDTTARMGFDRDGRIVAMQIDTLAALGGYLSNFAPSIPGNSYPQTVTGLYKTPNLHLRVRGVYTNTVPVDAYRGAGRPEAAYLLERLVDRAARELGAKPDALRRRNFIQPRQMPYKTPIGDRTYDTGDFRGHMERAMELADWTGFKERLRASRKARKLRGIGLATYIECTAWGEGEDAQVRLEEDGTVTVFSGTQSNGQGHATAYAQFAAEHLDVPLDRIRVVQGDTARVRTGNGTGGSRSIPIGGVSVGAASQDLARKLKELASDELEAAAADLEIADGAVRVVGTDRRIAFPELARLPGATEEARTGAASFVPPDATYPNGTHIAEVEIDPDTGVTALTRYTVCDDFGRAVNPLLLEGQVHGGVVQGIGQALHERAVYDAEGQLLTASFMDYALPRAEDVPFLRFETRNVPSTTNPLGIKGAGEAGSIGSCPAVMNAVVDALDRGHGLRDIDMPATPHAIRKALATR